MNSFGHTDHRLAQRDALSDLCGPSNTGLALLAGDSGLELAPDFVVRRVTESLDDILDALLLSEEKKTLIREGRPTVVVSTGATSYFQPSKNIIAVHPGDYLDQTTYLEEAGHYVRECLMPLDKDLNSNAEYVAARDEAVAAWSTWGKLAFLKIRKAETEESKALAVIGQVHEFFGSLMVGLQDQHEYESREKKARTPEAIIQFVEWTRGQGKLETHANQTYKNKAEIVKSQGLLQYMCEREDKFPKTSLQYLLRCAREIELALEHLDNSGDDGRLNKTIQRQSRKLEGLPHLEWGQEYLRYIELGRQCLEFSGSASGARPILEEMIMALREHKKDRHIQEIKIAALLKSTNEHEHGYAATKYHGRELLRERSQKMLTELFQMPSLEVLNYVTNFQAALGHATDVSMAELEGQMNLTLAILRGRNNI